MSVNLGDCKLFLIDSETLQVTDLTAEARAGAKSAKDPGGRIGPRDDQTPEPDLRNLSTQVTLCHEGDILLMVSDGVHDNFDPEMRGMSPLQAGVADATSSTTWSELRDVHLFKSSFMRDELQRILREAVSGKRPPPSPLPTDNSTPAAAAGLTTSQRSILAPSMPVVETEASPLSNCNNLPTLAELTAELTVSTVMDEVLRVTRPSREALETKLAQTFDLTAKLDHTTALAVRVGRSRK